MGLFATGMFVMFSAIIYFEPESARGYDLPLLAWISLAALVYTVIIFIVKRRQNINYYFRALPLIERPYLLKGIHYEVLTSGRVPYLRAVLQTTSDEYIPIYLSHKNKERMMQEIDTINSLLKNT